MAHVLLSSEAFIKSITSVSDNLAGKYLLPALREAQEIGLRGILGDALLSKLATLVSTGQIEAPGCEAYKTLLDRAQYYLAYSAVVEVTNKVSYKIGNFGVTKTTDENLQVATQDEIAKMQYYYQGRADVYCKQLQRFLIDNRANYPELSAAQCRALEAQLYSAASCGVFLGGARGKGGRRCV